MISPVITVSPAKLKSMIRSGKEFALIDVSEHGQYGMGHIVQASSIPYSVFEPTLLGLVPWQEVRLVITDYGNGVVAAEAAERAQSVGYKNVAVLEGGNLAWSECGYQLYKGEDIISKAFGETVEHKLHTPHISPQELRSMMDTGVPYLLLDTRTPEEHSAFRVPGSVNIPNGESIYRLAAVLHNDEMPVVMHCAGRTRSIIGAQTLINAGLRNPVMALSGGTMGWDLAGFELEKGNPDTRPAVEARHLEMQKHLRSTLCDRYNVPQISMSTLQEWRNDRSRATYLFDIRSADEYAIGHLPGSVHVPGGQLVQRTGRFCLVSGARVVLCDSEDLIRSTTTAHWLIQMGVDAYVVSQNDGATADLDPPPESKNFASSYSGCPEVSLPEVILHVSRGHSLINVSGSMNHRAGHIPGSIWGLRPILGKVSASLPFNEPVIIYGDSTDAAHLAAFDLRSLHSGPIAVYTGGFAEWKDAGGTVSTSPTSPKDAECIDFLFWGHGRQNGNQEAARAYFDWELALHTAMSADDTINFKIT